MSQKRQVAFPDRPYLDHFGDRRSQIIPLTHDYPAKHIVPLHFHYRDQLVYATRGVMTVRTRDGTWIVPTHRAVWIPASVPHTIVMSGTVAMRTLYLQQRLAKTLPRACCVVNVSPLLRELILHACTFAALKKAVRRQALLTNMIID